MERENIDFISMHTLIERKVKLDGILFEIIDFDFEFNGYPMYNIECNFKLNCLDDKQKKFDIDDLETIKEVGVDMKHIELIEESFEYEAKDFSLIVKVGK
jgi:hypothetical protein